MALPTDFIANLHFAPDETEKTIAKALFESRNVFSKHGLHPGMATRRAWQTGSKSIFGAWTLIQSDFAARTGKQLWGLDLMVYPAPQIPAQVLSIVVRSHPYPDSWTWLTPLIEDVCSFLGISFACISGFMVGRGHADGSGGPPMGPELSPGKVPSILCPWMYWGRERLASDKLTMGLKSLKAVAFRSSTSDDAGWVLQAYAGYDRKRPEQLLAAYADAFSVEKPKWAP